MKQKLIAAQSPPGFWAKCLDLFCPEFWHDPCVPASISIFALALLTVAWAGPAHAGLIGASVDVSAFFPTSTMLVSSGGTRTVSGAVEYPGGTYQGYGPTFEVNVTDTQLILTDTVQMGTNFNSASFNGFIMTVLSDPTLLSAGADASSGFNPVGISIVGGNQLLLNYQGVTFGPGGLSSIIDITTGVVVPEPGTLLLLGSGLAGLGARAWRRCHRG